MTTPIQLSDLPEIIVTSPFVVLADSQVWDPFERQLCGVSSDSSFAGRNLEIYKVLTTTSKSTDTATLLEMRPEWSYLVHALHERHLLVDAAQPWSHVRIHSLEIETSTHCNWRCTYCPVSKNPKAPQSMPMSLFVEIIIKGRELGSVETVTFNSYNEPTLDRYFEERAKIVADNGMRLILHTNASGLTERKIQTLRNLDVVKEVIFNMPAVTPDEFHTMTGARTYAQSLAAVDSCLDAGFKCSFSINGTAEQLAVNLRPLQDRYAGRVDDIRPWHTRNRAGLLQDYGEPLQLPGQLTGCHYLLNWLFISVNGELFICCEDYYQRETYGHINDGSLEELLSSSAAQNLRRRVFGASDARKDFICRKCESMLWQAEQIDMAMNTNCVQRLRSG